LFGAILAAFLVLAPRCGWADGVRIYAAGSLTGAFTDMIKVFGAPEGDVAAPTFGPSGVLREKIEHGDPVDVFASADMDQPRKLSGERGGRPVVMFTFNRLCALARTTLGITPDNMLDRLLDQKVRLATSTPGADPGGFTDGRNEAQSIQIAFDYVESLAALFQQAFISASLEDLQGGNRFLGHEWLAVPRVDIDHPISVGVDVMTERVVAMFLLGSPFQVSYALPSASARMFATALLSACDTIQKTGVDRPTN
jgi:hypothetical protein